MKLSKKDKSFIRKNYAEMSINDMAKHLNCSVDTVRRHAKSMGFPAKKKRAGKEVEEYIREHYSDTPVKEIAEKFGLKPSSIYNLAYYLGVAIPTPKVTLSEKQLDVIKLEYKGKSVKKLIKKLNIDIRPNVLAVRINRMGLRKEKRLSDADKEYIKAHFPIDSVKDIAKVIGITDVSVRRTAKIMGCKVKYKAKKNKKWGRIDIDVLKNTSLSHRQAAEATGRSYASVKAKRRELGVVVKVHDIDYYSDAEIEYIKANQHLSNVEMAKLMGRNVNALATKRRLLGLNPPDNTWSEEDVKYLIENYSIREKKEIAEQLNRPVSAIMSKASELGITRRLDYWNAEELNTLMDNIDLSSKDIATLIPNKSMAQIAYKKSYMRIKLYGREDKVVEGTLRKDVPYKFRSKLSSCVEYLKNMEIGDSFEYPVENSATMYEAMKFFPERLYRSVKANDSRIVWRLR